MKHLANRFSSYNRRSDGSQERDVETSRQLHTRDGQEERADRAYGVGETCRMIGEEEREDGDAMRSLTIHPLESFISFELAAFWLKKHMHLFFS
jgi:hypothetical protein